MSQKTHNPPQDAQAAKDAALRRSRNRLVDIARCLPFLSIILFFVPLLWGKGARPQDGAGGMLTSNAAIYVFIVWVLVILAAIVLARALRPVDQT